jgi:dihydrofolate reductase
VRQSARSDGSCATASGARAASVRLGVLDELRLVVNPVLLGGGTRLFDGAYAKADLRLTDVRRFASGALLLTYGTTPPGRVA